MARQHVHNRRAGHGSAGGGASWISYSDMMAALLLVFVLILCMSLYQYFMMLDTKSRELEAQVAIVSAQQVELDEKSATLTLQKTQLDSQAATLLQQQNQLDSQTAALVLQQAKLDEQATTLAVQQTALDAANQIVTAKEAQLTVLQAQLDAQQTQLASQQALLASQQDKLNQQQLLLTQQTSRIDDLVGIRSQIITDLSNTFASKNMKASVDKANGEIILDSAVFFVSGKYEIKEEGKALLDSFIPVYLEVLLRPEYSEYLGEIIIEGHTDSTGSYINNLKLSQNRAMSVAEYVLQMPTLTDSQRELLKKILTATGRSYSDLIYNEDGTENKDASRRVEFKFSLRDAEMIDEMNRLLSGGEE